MTDLLRSTLAERADGLAPYAPDLDLIEATGAGRVRRRRLATTGLAALVVAAAVGLVLVLPVGGRQAPTVGRELPLDTTVYAVGSTLHVGKRQVDVGRRVDALVQTTTGVVYTSGRTVWQWTTGTQRRLGTVLDPHDDQRALVVDERGRDVAWISDESTPRLTVLDSVSGEVRRIGVALDGPGRPSVRSVDDGVVWYAHHSKLSGWNWRDGRQVGGWAPVPNEAVLDVRAGWFLTATPENARRQGSVLSRSPIGTGQFFDAVWTEATLSPHAKRLFSESVDDDTTVLDAGSGRRTDVRHPGFYFAAGYRWLDDDRFLAAAVRREGQTTFSLLTCSVAAATCRLLAPDVGGFDQIALPMGLDISE